MWSAGSGKQLFVLPLPGKFPTAIFSPSGTRVLTASQGSSPTIWDSQTGDKVVAMQGFAPGGYAAAGYAAAVSPDGGSVAAGTGSQAVRIWRTEDGMPIKTLVAPKTWPNGIAFSADGMRILVGTWETISYSDNLSSLWDVSSGTEIAQFGGHRSDTHGGTFSHDGRLAATVSVDGTARLWDGITGRFVSSLGEESDGLKLIDAKVNLPDQEINAAFSPDDQFLATVSLGGGVHIWDIKSGSQFAVIRSHKGLVERVAFSPIGHLLLTASHDGTARLWDIDGVLTTTLRHQIPPTFAAFSPDGTRVVTGGQNRVGHIWDVASGREIARLESQGGQLQDATFSPDGRRIATAARSGVVIWDAASGRQIARLKGHDSVCLRCKVQPEGRHLVIRVCRWDGASMECIDRGSALCSESRRKFAEGTVQPRWPTRADHGERQHRKDLENRRIRVHESWLGMRTRSRLRPSVPTAASLPRVPSTGLQKFGHSRTVGPSPR